MGDRSIVRGNRLAHARNDDYLWNLHQGRLTEMKSTLDTAPPQSMQYKHLDQRLKQRQMAHERQQQIEKDNFLLLNQMRDILLKPQTVLEEPAYKPSLNQDLRRRELLKIMRENEQILHRIHGSKSAYNVKKFEEDFEKSEKTAARVGQFAYESKFTDTSIESGGGRRPPLKNFSLRPLNPSQRFAEQRALSPEKAEQKLKRPAAPARICIFSERDVPIKSADGTAVPSILSVYERTQGGVPKLEFVSARASSGEGDEAAASGGNVSTSAPLLIAMSAVRAHCTSQGQSALLKADNTRALITYLLDFLHYAAAGADEPLRLELSSSFAPAPSSPPPIVAAPAKRAETKAKPAAKPTVRAAAVPARAQATPRGAPADEEKQADDADAVGGADVAKGGANLGGIDVLYRVGDTDDGSGWLFSLYSQANSRTFTHTVLASAFASLAAELSTSAPASTRGPKTPEHTAFAKKLVSLFSFDTEGVREPVALRFRGELVGPTPAAGEQAAVGTPLASARNSSSAPSSGRPDTSSVPAASAAPVPPASGPTAAPAPAAASADDDEDNYDGEDFS